MTDSKLPEQNNFKTDIGKSNEPIESYSSQHKSDRQELVFVLGGSVHEINPVRQRIIETHLHKISGYTQLIVTDIEEEKTKLKVKGSLLSLEKLQKLFVEGKLLEILGIPIEYIYFLRHNTKDKYNQDDGDNLESSLVRDILENGAFGKDLTNADLKKANLAGADLNGCDLSGANLEKANLEGANLFYVNLNRTIIDSHTKLDDKWLLVWQIVNQQVEKHLLIGANLSCTYLVNANLFGANLRDTNFSDAILEGVNLESANLERANLTNSNLEGANLVNANLSNANLTNADLSYSDLSGGNIKGANLINADLSNANVSSANLSHAILNHANLIRANFTDANLESTNLIKAYLSGANLIRANLRRAKLSNAHLDAAYLISADLRGANLSNAFLDAANFKGAKVENTRFGNNPGISQLFKDDLIRRGGIF
ncbi:MAG: pentapeptide repeat-containing protein [Rivularia sp. (in: cyanobacteria)]